MDQPKLTQSRVTRSLPKLEPPQFDPYCDFPKLVIYTQVNPNWNYHKLAQIGITLKLTQIGIILSLPKLESPQVDPNWDHHKSVIQIQVGCQVDPN